MSIENYLKKSLCPRCKKSSLCFGDATTIVCARCGSSYPIVNGVPIFISEEGVEGGISGNNLQKTSYEYWNGGIPGTVEGGYQSGKISSEYGNADWYKQGDNIRYLQYKALEGFCEFEKYKGKKVLDIGPGRGQESHNFVNNGAEVSILEYAGQGVEIVNKRLDCFGLDADLIQADAVSIPYADNVFDLVFSYGVLHHIPDMKRSVSEILRVLKPGGIAKIMVYHKGYFYYKDMFFKWYILKGNFIRYTWNEYKKIAMEQKEGPCPVVYIMSMKEILELFKDFDVVDWFNDEVIDGREIRYGIIPQKLVRKYRNILGAYCHLTLRKNM